MQHLLTGVYIGELALFGIFALRKTTGPSIIISIMFIVTVIFNGLMNKSLAPLEEFLPTELVNVPEAAQESTPLLRSGGEAEAQVESRIQRMGQRAHVPPTLARHVLDPLARFCEPGVFTSYEVMRSWLQDGDYHAIQDDTPEYKEGDLKKAYLNPVLTSPTPPIWLAKDEFGISSIEVRENDEYGLKASDQGAWLSKDGKLSWSTDDFTEVPIWKEKVRY